ncbi:formylmethanofuran dehydrogenase subunit C [Roseixanthobacter glucoisosaccharinicivorans]|uniref:formylmethanofuran dehydrogenase subunit C n=1 Tax=Roseixanthobacter glucoisosaccharinicivorans TaxID=3119923 RepID=UPI00372ACB7D
MSGYELRLRGSLAARLDLSGITPHALAELSRSEVERLPLAYGTTRLPLGELFAVVPAAEGVLRISGDPRLDFVGAALAPGEMMVSGPVGAFAGAQMVGGELIIEGDAGEGVGSGMSGGRIQVRGHVGARLGGPLPGARIGMSGGTIEIRGDAGPLAAANMRAGLMLVHGDVAEHAARGMIAGTIAIAGTLGPQAGAGMKRGTLLLAREPLLLGPGFGDAGEHDLIALHLLARRVPQLAELFGGGISGRARRYVGDRLAGGEGELLWLY